jgi:integrase/recombinase XerD
MIPLCCAVALRGSALLPFPLTACPCHPTPTVQSQGKGRRARALPLWKQAADELRAWLAVRGLLTVPDVFLSAPGRPMTRMGFTHRLHQEKERAATHGPSLTETHGPPHVLRHPWAMVILQATGDRRKGSLWLGPADMQTTEGYLRADPTEKLEALASIRPPALRRGQCTGPDKLIASLRGA